MTRRKLNFHKCENRWHTSARRFTVVNMAPIDDVRRVIDSLLAQGMTQQEIGRRLGVKTTTVNYYKNGRVNDKGEHYYPEPTVRTWEAALEVEGYSISKTRPSDVEIAQTRDPLRVMGTVSAGVTRVAEQEIRVISGPSAAWSGSKYWGLTTGAVFYLEVTGDSMEPDYPNGCLLACAPSAVGAKDIPNFTPVIARVHDSDDCTFKLYRRTLNEIGREVADLIPLNKSHDLQRYRLRDVAVSSIVLGFLNPWRRGVSIEYRAPVLRDSG